jgi:hypothetical protein
MVTPARPTRERDNRIPGAPGVSLTQKVSKGNVLYALSLTVVLFARAFRSPQ